MLKSFLIWNISKFLRAPILKNTSERLLLYMFMKTVTMMKLRNIKIVHKGFCLYIKKQDLLALRQEATGNVYLFCFYFMIGFLWSLYLYTIFIRYREK